MVLLPTSLKSLLVCVKSQLFFTTYVTIFETLTLIKLFLSSAGLCVLLTVIFIEAVFYSCFIIEPLSLVISFVLHEKFYWRSV